MIRLVDSTCAGLQRIGCPEPAPLLL